MKLFSLSNTKKIIHLLLHAHHHQLLGSQKFRQMWRAEETFTFHSSVFEKVDLDELNESDPDTDGDRDGIGKRRKRAADAKANAKGDSGRNGAEMASSSSEADAADEEGAGTGTDRRNNPMHKKGTRRNEPRDSFNSLVDSEDERER